MKEELTIEHLSPYNFKLNGRVEIITDEGELKVWENEEIESVGISDKYLTFNNAWDVYLDNTSESKFIPYLNPLSMLTEEIEVDAEKFVPSEKLDELCDVENDYDWMQHFYDIHPGYIEWRDAPHWMVKKLHRWHFTVNIPEHLYIDKTTI